MRHRRGWQPGSVGVGVVLFALLAPRWAGAQLLAVAEEGGAAAVSHSVTLRSKQPNVTWEVRRVQGDTVGGCSEQSCTLQLPEGRYLLRDLNTPPQRAVALEVNADRDLTVRAPNHNARDVGLATAITGKVLAVTGMALVLAHAFRPLACFAEAFDDDGTTDPFCREGSLPPLPVAVAALAGGAVMIPVGWVTFHRNRRPTIKRTHTGAPPAAPRSPHVELGVQRFGAGGGIGLRATF